MAEPQDTPHRKRTRARDGHMAEGGRRAHELQQRTRETPLDFAKSIFRDPAQPIALRVRMAAVAMPYMHKRGEEQEPEDKPQKKPISDLDLARRIARILELGRQQAEREGKVVPELGMTGEAPAPLNKAAPDPLRNGVPAPSTHVDQPHAPPAAPSQPQRRWQPPGHVQPIDAYDSHSNYRWI